MTDAREALDAAVHAGDAYVAPEDFGDGGAAYRTAVERAIVVLVVGVLERTEGWAAWREELAYWRAAAERIGGAE